MGAHKRSATIEVVDDQGAVLSKARFGTDPLGYRDMLADGRRFADRVWAIEGGNGIGQAHRPPGDARHHVGQVARARAAAMTSAVCCGTSSGSKNTEPGIVTTVTLG